MAPSVRMEGVTKRFGEFTAVRELDLDVERGEFFTLLGPSGCGKTTTLRMVAGFEEPTEGQVLLDGADVTGLPAFKRPTNTVFQNYALFPHLTVAKNVAFGLTYAKLTKAETAERVGLALELTQMSGFADRRPSQLSGGQQQRVALARALVLNPKVLLLDEPLGALDAQLRRRLQLDLRALQREVGITFVYVTHDQEEALTMSDRIAVLAGGRVEQVGAPQEIYSSPGTTYVAGFLGSANIFDAELLSVTGSGAATCKALGGAVEARLETDLRPGPAAIVIRPERIFLLRPDEEAPAGHGNRIAGVVRDVVYLGANTQVLVTVDADLQAPAPLTVEVPNHSGPGSVGLRPGDRVVCACAPEAVRVLKRSEEGRDHATPGRR